MPLDLENLCCPRCRVPLPRLSAWPESGGQCPRCQELFPRVREIVRFVPTDAYVGSFSFEWTRHAQTQLDDMSHHESEQTFRAKMGLTPADVEGRLILDVGCGMGRFADVVSRWGGRVVGIDLSHAVDAAQANIGDRQNVVIFQADCFHLPFTEQSFDLIYSIGVLHHTPDCAKAFRALVPYLKPGGMIAIWVYGHMGLWGHVADVYRQATTRLPPWLLYGMCHVAVPLYYLHRLPAIGCVTRKLFPTSMHEQPAWRVLDTFDWYSPRFQSKHSPEEVKDWFRAAGLTEVSQLDFPVAVRGRLPASGMGDAQ